MQWSVVALNRRVPATVCKKGNNGCAIVETVPMFNWLNSESYCVVTERNQTGQLLNVLFSADESQTALILPSAAHRPWKISSFLEKRGII